MGGFSGTPGLDDDQTLTPAPDVPPESFVSISDVAGAGTSIAEAISGSPIVKGALEVLKVGGELALLVFLFTHIKDIVDLWKKYVVPHIPDVANDVIVPLTDLIAPIADAFGTLSAGYVSEVTRHYSMEPGGATKSSGTPVGNAAQQAFDSIVAPISFFTSGSDPSQDGAGTRNLQQTLGVIVQLHLITWVVNVISNLSGIGALHYINSFNEVLLASLNARGLSRVAMRPYLNTMIVEPITGELNTKWPLKSPAASSDIKQYIRGGITSDQLRTNMAKLGYNADVTAQLLLDNAHLMSVDDVAYVVKSGEWTMSQGVTYLQQLGYDAASAPVVLTRQIRTLITSNRQASADKLGAFVEKGILDDQTYVDILLSFGFTTDEASSYRILYTISREFTTPLTYTQVKDLYAAGLVDLDFVQQYLTNQHNAPSDIDLLILLDFTAKDQLDVRKAAMGATARVQATKEKAAAATATAKGEAALAAALTAQSVAKSALAAKYGQ